MNHIIIISIIICLIVLILIIGAPLKTLRLIGQGITKVLIGAILLFFLNMIGNQFGLYVPINIVTATISGLLGISGIVSLIAIQLFIL